MIQRKKYKIFLNALVLNFKKNYTLNYEITIDKSLIHFTGRNKMKFYLPMKPHKWGFKIHLLCGHLHHIIHILKANKSYKFCIKKTSYFCGKCNIPIRPECFTEFYNKYIYNNHK